MKRVVTALALVPIVLLLVLKGYSWLFGLAVAFVGLLAMKEYLDLAEAMGIKPFRICAYFFSILPFSLLAIAIPESSRIPHAALSLTALIALIAAPYLMLIAGLRREESTILPGVGVTLVSIFYIGFSLSMLIDLRAYSAGWLYLFFVFAVVWFGDIAAFYVGRSIGKHKLAPRISPNKSWEGAVASTIAACAVALTLNATSIKLHNLLVHLHLLRDESGVTKASIPVILLLAVCINIAAQLGDLVESALKRGAGMKDSGSVLPGHGGVLDRIDALLFAVPMAMLLFTATDQPFSIRP